MQLLDYIVKSLMGNRLPLTEESIKDLLTVCSPGEIENMTAEEAIVVDAGRPAQLILDYIAPMTLREAANVHVETPEGRFTVSQLVSSGKPYDFALACIKIPMPICRWYVLEYLSEVGKLWPAGNEIPSDIETIDTRFTKDHIHRNVTKYLDEAPVDISWISIFGLEDGVSIDSSKVKTTRQIIIALLGYLSGGNVTPWIIIDPIFDKNFRKVAEIFELYPVIHYDEVRYAKKVSDFFTNIVRKSDMGDVVGYAKRVSEKLVIEATS